MAKAEKKAVVTAGMYDVIVSPVVTEKSQMGVEFNKVTFNIAPWATKPQVKQAVEKLFETKVEKVNVLNSKGKVKRFRGTIGKRNDVKKAIVTLAEGETIDVAASA
jgi:large subunit ribosomal protein L23